MSSEHYNFTLSNKWFYYSYRCILCSKIFSNLLVGSLWFKSSHENFLYSQMRWLKVENHLVMKSSYSVALVRLLKESPNTVKVSINRYVQEAEKVSLTGAFTPKI